MASAGDSEPAGEGGPQGLFGRIFGGNSKRFKAAKMGMQLQMYFHEELKCWVMPGEEDAKRREIATLAAPPPPSSVSSAGNAALSTGDAGIAVINKANGGDNSSRIGGPPMYGGPGQRRTGVAMRYAAAPSLGVTDSKSMDTSSKSSSLLPNGNLKPPGQGLLPVGGVAGSVRPMMFIPAPTRPQEEIVDALAADEDPVEGALPNERSWRKLPAGLPLLPVTDDHPDPVPPPTHVEASVRKPPAPATIEPPFPGLPNPATLEVLSFWWYYRNKGFEAHAMMEWVKNNYGDEFIDGNMDYEHMLGDLAVVAAVEEYIAANRSNSINAVAPPPLEPTVGPRREGSPLDSIDTSALASELLAEAQSFEQAREDGNGSRRGVLLHAHDQHDSSDATTLVAGPSEVGVPWPSEVGVPWPSDAGNLQFERQEHNAAQPPIPAMESTEVNGWDGEIGWASETIASQVVTAEYHAEQRTEYGEHPEAGLSGGEERGADATGAEQSGQDPTIGEALGSVFQLDKLTAHFRIGDGGAQQIDQLLSSVGGPLTGFWDAAAKKPGKLPGSMPWEVEGTNEYDAQYGDDLTQDKENEGTYDGKGQEEANNVLENGGVEGRPHPHMMTDHSQALHNLETGYEREQAKEEEKSEPDVFSPGRLAADLGVPRTAVTSVTAALFVGGDGGSEDTLSSKDGDEERFLERTDDFGLEAAVGGHDQGSVTYPDVTVASGPEAEGQSEAMLQPYTYPENGFSSQQPVVDESAGTWNDEWGSTQGRDWVELSPDVVPQFVSVTEGLHQSEAEPRPQPGEESFSEAADVSGVPEETTQVIHKDELESLRARWAAAEAELAHREEMEHALANANAELGELRSQFEAAQAEGVRSLQAAEERLAMVNEELEMLRDRCQQAETNLQERTIAHDALITANAELKLQASTLQEHLDGTQTAMENVEARNSELMQRINELEASTVATEHRSVHAMMVLQAELEDTKSKLANRDCEFEDLKAMMELKDDAINALKTQEVRAEGLAEELHATKEELAASEAAASDRVAAALEDVRDRMQIAVAQAVAEKDAELARIEMTLRERAREEVAAAEAGLQMALDEKDAEIANLEAKTVTAESELLQAQTRMKELEKKFALAKKKIAAQGEELGMLRTQVAELQATIEVSIGGRDEEMAEMTAALEAAQAHLAAETASLQARLEEVVEEKTAELEALAADNATLAALLAEKDAAAEAYEQKLAQTREESSRGMEAELDAARDEISQWMAVAEDADARCTHAEESMAEAQAARDEAAHAAQQMQRELLALQAALTSAEGQLAEITDLQEAMASVAGEEETQRRRAEAAEAALAEAKAALLQASRGGYEDALEEAEGLRLQLGAASQVAAAKEEELRKYKLQLVRAKKLRASDAEKISELEAQVKLLSTPGGAQDNGGMNEQELEALRAACCDAEGMLNEALAALGQEEAKVARLAELLLENGFGEDIVAAELAAIDEMAALEEEAAESEENLT